LAAKSWMQKIQRLSYFTGNLHLVGEDDTDGNPEILQEGHLELKKRAPVSEEAG
jgi:hypothetical protein